MIRRFTPSSRREKLLLYSSGPRPVIIECVAIENTVRQRLQDRLNSSDRHWSHPDAERLNQIEAGNYDWNAWSVDLQVPTLRVSTDRAVYEPSLDAIVRWIGRASESSKLT